MFSFLIALCRRCLACEEGLRKWRNKDRFRRNILWAKGSNSDRTSKNLNVLKHCFFLRNVKADVIFETDSIFKKIKHQLLQQALVGYFRSPFSNPKPIKIQVWGIQVWHHFLPGLSFEAKFRALCGWQLPVSSPQPNHLRTAGNGSLWLKKHRRRRGLDVLYEVIPFWVMLPNMFHSVAVLSFFWAD